MAYDGSAVPGTAQPPNALNNNIQMQYAIAKALLGNQPQFMQSRLQPVGQIAQAALAGKMINDARAAQQTNMATGLPMGGSAAAAPGAGAQGAGSNPFSSLFGSIFGGGSSGP